MHLDDAIRRRRMVRAFTAAPVDEPTLLGLLDLARRAPAAGNTDAVDFVVLVGPTETARYWDVTLPADRRAGFRWPGLLAAPALVLVVVRPAAYPERYAEADKAGTGLGAGLPAWPVPYWWVDAGAVVQNLLLLLTAHDLGGCFFGVFEHEPAVRAALGVPDDRRLVGAVALGHPAGDDAPGRSAGRGRPELGSVVHRGRW